MLPPALEGEEEGEHFGEAPDTGEGLVVSRMAQVRDRAVHIVAIANRGDAERISENELAELDGRTVPIRIAERRVEEEALEVEAIEASQAATVPPRRRKLKGALANSRIGQEIPDSVA